MKKREESAGNTWKYTSLALLVGIVVVLGTGPSAEAKVPKEALQALGMLEAAKQLLYRAPRDEEGNRARAIDTTRQAIAELKALALPVPPPKEPAKKP